LATASWDRLIHLWNVATGEKVATFNGHKAGVLEVAFSSDSRTLASSSDDWTVKLWHVESLRELATMQMPVKIYCLRFAPDDSQLIVTEASQHAPVYLWQAPYVNQ
jgi:WD40 repeat protein